MRIRSSPLAFVAVLVALWALPAAAGQGSEATKVGTETCVECHDTAERLGERPQFDGCRVVCCVAHHLLR